MAEMKVAPAAALEEFNRMCTIRHIELDETDWTAEDKEGFSALRKRICRLISRGQVTVDANGDPTFGFGTPAIKLGKPKGSSLVAMDEKVGNMRVFCALADIAGIDTVHFVNLPLHEVRMLEDFFILFFQR